MVGTRIARGVGLALLLLLASLAGRRSVGATSVVRTVMRDERPTAVAVDARVGRAFIRTYAPD